jgi:hypothetical protein
MRYRDLIQILEAKIEKKDDPSKKKEPRRKVIVINRDKKQKPDYIEHRPVGGFITGFAASAARDFGQTMAKHGFQPIVPVLKQAADAKKKADREDEKRQEFRRFR